VSVEAFIETLVPSCTRGEVLLGPFQGHWETSALILLYNKSGIAKPIHAPPGETNTRRNANEAITDISPGKAEAQFLLNLQRA
jgi:hypothetical protein